MHDAIAVLDALKWHLAIAFLVAATVLTYTSIREKELSDAASRDR